MKLKIILFLLSFYVSLIPDLCTAAAADLSDYRELLDKGSSGDAKRPVLASKDLAKLTLAQAEDNYQEALKLITSKSYRYSFTQAEGTKIRYRKSYGDSSVELYRAGGLVGNLLDYLRPAFEAGHFKAASLLEVVLGDNYSIFSSSRKLRDRLIERDFVLRFIYNHPSAAATLRSLMLSKIGHNAERIRKIERNIRNNGCGVHVGLCFLNTICGCGYCHWIVDDLCTDCLGRCCGTYV